MKTQPGPRDMNVDELIIHFEPAIVAGQFNQAVRRLRDHFEELVKHDLQAGRALTERVHLIAGDRRMKVLEVDHDRRVKS